MANPYLNSDMRAKVMEFPGVPADQKFTDPPAIWVEPGTLVTMDDLELNYGNFYFGSHVGATYGESNSNGVVDPKLALKGSSDFVSYDPNEPPSYRTLSPRLRREYLVWLSDGAVEYHVPEEFPSIYFYGLEHRLMIDKKGDDARVFAEIKRVVTMFPNVQRLQRDFARLEMFVNRRSGFQMRPLFTKQMVIAHIQPPSVLLYFGKKMLMSGVFDGRDAWLWVQASFEIYLPRSYYRCRREFEALFLKLFQELYPNGMRVGTTTDPLRLIYRTATCHRVIEFSLPPELKNLGNVAAVPNLIKVLDALVKRCEDGLEAYDRLLARKPSAAGTIEVIKLLPPQMLCSPWIGKYAGVRKVMYDCLEKASFISTSVTQFLEMIDVQGKAKGALNAKVVGQIEEVLDAFHLGFEPDRRFGAYGLQGHGGICLFKAKEGGHVDASTPRYRAARLLFEIIVLAAAADDEVNQKEMDVLKKIFDDIVKLSQTERMRITALTRALIKKPVLVKEMTDQLCQMPSAFQKKAVELAIEIIKADGTANVKEIQYLESLYDVLGWPVGDLYSSIHRSETDEPVRIMVASAVPGVAVPPQVTASVESLPAVVIDTRRLAQMREETAAVSSMLSQIFEADEISEGLDLQESAAASSDDSMAFDGLDQEHGALLCLLLEEGVLTESGWQDFCLNSGIMASAALETINDWGFDNIGDAIVETDGGYRIFAEFRDEIAARRKS